MDDRQQKSVPASQVESRARGRWELFWAALVALTMSGCSAIRPVQGTVWGTVPVEYRAADRSVRKTIDLSILRQHTPPEHVVDTGDVLGVYIEGVLGNKETTPPVYVPDAPGTDPSLGYPIRVDSDGTISLPMRSPLAVRGMTIAQVRQLVRSAYTTGPDALLRPNRDHIHVALQKPRSFNVIVIREEAGNAQGNRGAASVVNFESDKRGTGRVVNLPVYRNDVLNALTETGGLPGLDADNVICVIRGNGSQSTNGCQCHGSVPLPGHTNAGLAPRAPVIRASSPDDSNWYWVPGHHEPSFSNSQDAYFGRTGSPTRQGRQSGRANRVCVLPAAATNASLQPSRSESLTRTLAAAPLPQSISVNPGPPVVPSTAHPTLGLSGHALPVSHANPSTNLLPAQTASFGCTTLPAAGCPTCRRCGEQRTIIRIPLKAYPGEQLDVCPEDVVLRDGDIVFVENRITDFFFTAGLLGGGQFILPRDYDIGIMDAIALAEADGRRNLPTSTIGGASVLNQDVSVGASRAIIQRKVGDGSVVPIEVNLYKVMQNPDQQVLIRPGDRIILRYTRAEACAAFFERFFIDGLVTGFANSVNVAN